MGIQINFNTDDLTADDIKTLSAIANSLADTTAAPAAAAPVATKAPAPAKKAAAPAPAKAEPVPEPAAEPVAEPDEDLVGGGATVDDAVKQAMALVTDGKSALVKKALESLDPKPAKVSSLKPEQVEAFLAVLNA